MITETIIVSEEEFNEMMTEPVYNIDLYPKMCSSFLAEGQLVDICPIGLPQSALESYILEKGADYVLISPVFLREGLCQENA